MALCRHCVAVHILSCWWFANYSPRHVNVQYSGTFQLHGRKVECTSSGRILKVAEGLCSQACQSTESTVCTMPYPHFVHLQFSFLLEMRNMGSSLGKTGVTVFPTGLLQGYRALFAPLRILLDTWGCKPGTVPSLKGTIIVMWCGQYHSKSQQHDGKCTATHQY